MGMSDDFIDATKLIHFYELAQFWCKKITKFLSKYYYLLTLIKFQNQISL